jgi:hypothetical protein
VNCDWLMGEVAAAEHRAAAEAKFSGAAGETRSAAETQICQKFKNEFLPDKSL